jgi:hypothetical protein
MDLGSFPDTACYTSRCSFEQDPWISPDAAAMSTSLRILSEVFFAEASICRRFSTPFDARIVVDANQGWTFSELAELAPLCASLGVQMIEQPLRRGDDAELEKCASPVPLCADESCLHLDELEQATSRYQWINIKLDKTGGLTHALAPAPAFVTGCLAELVDIDGPPLQQFDRPPGLGYDGGWVSVFKPNVWR